MESWEPLAGVSRVGFRWKIYRLFLNIMFPLLLERLKCIICVSGWGNSIPSPTHLPNSEFLKWEGQLLTPVLLCLCISEFLHTWTTQTIAWVWPQVVNSAFSNSPSRWSQDQPHCAFADFRLMQVCRHILNVTGQRVYISQRKLIRAILFQKNKGVYLGNWIVSHFVKQYFEVFEMSHPLPTQRSQLMGCTHLKLTVQWYNLFPLQFTKASSSISLSPTPTQFSLLK